MCGIVGIYSQSKEVTPSQMEASLNSIEHRGPDGRGSYFSPSQKVGLGHVRLAIMDTEGGQQPLFNEDRSLVLVANGEFYDFERIREELQAEGHRFKTLSDSEIAVHLFESQGLESIKKLRGEFAFILYDIHKNELIAFRDRFGIKPLFYAHHHDQIIIASEIKALFAAGVPAQWDEDNVYQSMHFASLEGSTLYKNVFQVPPGHCLHLKPSGKTLTKYWDTDYPTKNELTFSSEEDVIREVKTKLEEAIKLRTRSDVPIACYLSGGVDSSTVLGMANRLTGKKIPAFTIAFDHEDFDESALAATMCRFTQSPFHPIKVTNQDFADVFSEAIEKSDMPFYNGHAPARFILSREVKKKGFKVVLGGEGADELFAGYHFSQAALSGSRKSVFKILSRLVQTPTAEILKIKNISPTLFWVARVLGFPPELAASLMERYEHLQEFQDPQFIQRHLSSDPYKDFLWQFPIYKNLRRAPFHVVLYLWMKSHFPQYVLAAERLDMAHAVELRLPFLDHELFEVTKKLPASLLYKNNLNKYLLRTIAQGDVCPEVLTKLKQPFVSPPSTLGNDNPLFTMVCDLIQGQDFRDIPFFHHSHIENLIPKIKKMDDQERAPYDPLFYYLASLAVLKRKYKIS